MEKLNRYRFVIATLGGLAAVLMAIHVAAVAVGAPQSKLKPIAPINFKAAKVEANVAPWLSIAPADLLDISASDDYAHARGYRDWNHYLAHRPSNKMGKHEVDEAIPDIAPVTRFTTFNRDALEEAAQYEPALTQDVGIDQPQQIALAATLLPSDTPDWIERPYGATSKPVSTQVPEPSSLALFGAGFALMLFNRAWRHQ